jgi:hypothetical protein
MVASWLDGWRLMMMMMMMMYDDDDGFSSRLGFGG